MWRAALLPVLLATCPTPARAHSPPEGLSVLTDEQGAVVVVVTNRGLLLRDPATDRTRLLCAEAMHATATNPPHVALLSGGRLVIGTFDGLRASSDQGCTWEPVPPFGTTSVTAMAMGQQDLQTLYVATFDADTSSGLHVTHDGGQTFKTLGALNDTEYVSSLAVSSGDPNRLYAGVEDFSTGEVALVLLRSFDGGNVWERVALDQQPTDFRLVVQAVDPQDPDSLLMSSLALDPVGTPERLLESHDAGDSFAVVFDDFEISGAGYRRDGSAWATSGSGLFESTSAPTNLTQTWDMIGVSCAAEHEGELYVCGNFPEDDRLVPGLGLRVSDAEQPIAPYLLFSEADQRVACEPMTDGEQRCQVPWLDWQREVLAVDTTAAGASPSGDPGAEAAPNVGMMATASAAADDDAAPPDSALQAPAVPDGSESAQPTSFPPSTSPESAVRDEHQSNRSGCSVSGAHAPLDRHERRWWGIAILGWTTAWLRANRKKA